MPFDNRNKKWNKNRNRDFSKKRRVGRKGLFKSRKEAQRGDEQRVDRRQLLKRKFEEKAKIDEQDARFGFERFEKVGDKKTRMAT